MSKILLLRSSWQLTCMGIVVIGILAKVSNLEPTWADVCRYTINPIEIVLIEWFELRESNGDSVK